MNKKEKSMGEYYSWLVINENTIIKKGDKSFFEHNGSGVPKEIKWFFSAEKLKHNDRLKIEFLYLRKIYNGKVEIDKLERCRIFWNSDLGKEYNKVYNKDISEYPLIRFHKIEKNVYEIEFIDESIIMDEKNEPYETILPQKEGKKKEYYVTKYERNPVNRKRAIEIHGTKCIICGFDFEEQYGEAGRNYIEVHHIKPLSEINDEVIIDPQKDLVCVCANCHRIIHRRRDRIYSIEEVRQMLK